MPFYRCYETNPQKNLDCFPRLYRKLVLEPGCRLGTADTPVCKYIVFHYILLWMFVGFRSVILSVSAPYFACFGGDEIFSCRSIFMY